MWPPITLEGQCCFNANHDCNGYNNHHFMAVSISGKTINFQEKDNKKIKDDTHIDTQ